MLYSNSILWTTRGYYSYFFRPLYEFYRRLYKVWHGHRLCRLLYGFCKKNRVFGVPFLGVCSSGLGGFFRKAYSPPKP